MAKHPGRVLLEDYLLPLGLTANQLAKALGMNRSTVGRLISGGQRMSPEMAARLGAYFDVPARWWLLMQAEFDAALVAARPELSADVEPMPPNPDVLLTPTGVLRLGPPGATAPSPPLSIPREELDKLPPVAPGEPREVKVVRYESGSVALVGEPT